MENNGLNDIQKTIDAMKNMADFLIDYSYPKMSFKYEEQILCLKQQTIRVDGNDLIVSYSKADYEDHILETLQIQSQQVPFIPFNVICKTGRLFLGHKNLSYVDFFKYNRKTYCWVVKSLDGERLQANTDSSVTSFEGFEFYVLPPGSVDLL